MESPFRSQEFNCTECGKVKDKLKPVTEASKAETEEAKELASQINFQVFPFRCHLSIFRGNGTTF